MKKQCDVLSIDKRMPILAEAGADMETRVHIAAMLGLSVSTLNMIVSKRSGNRGKFTCIVGHHFLKSLKTLPLEELETVLSVWFKQAHTANTSIDGPHLKEKSLHVAAHLSIFNFQTSNGWIDHFKKWQNLVYKTMLGESVIVNPETERDWKSEELPKIIDT